MILTLMLHDEEPDRGPDLPSSAPACRQLIHLDLSGNSIGPEGAAALARQAAQHWSRLQHLLLNSAAVGNAGAQALAQHGAAHWPGLVVLSLQVRERTCA
jgi:Ran GTPase-activating protein (RanGAP) involved in mRNA processing and transport